MIVRILFIFLYLTLTSAARSELPKSQPKYCNHHKFTFVLLKIYDVSLCSNDKEYFSSKEIYNSNFSLKINYNLDFNKEDLAKSSIKEISRYYEINQRTSENYYSKLLDIFPVIKKGDIIEAKYHKEGFTDFYHNDNFSGKIKDAEFSKIFLDIWLHKNNKHQKMSKDLFAKID